MGWFWMERTQGPESRMSRGNGMANITERLALAWITLFSVLLFSGCSESPLSPGLLEPVELAESWREGSPSSEGFRRAGIEEAIEAAGNIARMQSLLVARNGTLVVEEYFHGNRANSLNDLRSVTKSVVSTLTGMAIEHGYLTGLDQTLGELLPDAPFQDPQQREITVEHLLTMSAGFDWYERGAIGYNDWILSEDRVAYLLERPVLDPPGTTFNYNSAAVHLLGVVLEEASGTTLPDLADAMLFGPIGITRSRWERLSPHYNAGAGLDLRPRDLARIGQLFLQRGWSGDRRILSESWIQRATRPAFPWRSSFGPLRGLSYGFLWWTDQGPRGDTFLAWGYGGQFLYAVPDLDLVVVATTEWRGVSQDEGADAVEEAVLGVIVNRVLASVR
jgi:CubicO group peptidase (beta-lactamase class C family)